MPNHITNVLVFKNTKARADFLRDYASKGEDAEEFDCVFNLNIVFPMPPEFEDNWYAWRIENWGTKWNTYGGSLVPADFRCPALGIRGNRRALLFQTAWAPPTPCLEEVSKKHKFVHFWTDEGDCVVYEGRYFPDDVVGSLSVPTNHRQDTVYGLWGEAFDFTRDLLVETAASYHQDTHRTKEQR